MKIKLYYEYEDCVTIIEVPDDECEIMAETDYKQHLRYLVTLPTTREMPTAICAETIRQ